MGILQSLVNDVLPGSPAGTNVDYSHTFNVGATDPNYIRNYLGTQANAPLAQRQQLASQLASNKAGISSQEISAALGLGSTQGGGTAPGGTGDPGIPTGGTAGGTADPAPGNTAYWQQQLSLIDDQLNRLPGEQQVGANNAQSAYDSAFNTLTNQQGQATRDYNTTKDQNTQDNVAAKTAIDTGVHNQISSLMRLLGARGAGSSSASTIAAPVAAGLQGAQQRGAENQTYGRNDTALNTAFGDTTTQFQNAFGGLLNDKQNQDRSLQANADKTKQQLLQTRAQALANLNAPADPAIASQISSLGSQIDSLGAAPTFTPAAVNYAAPTLNSLAPAANNAPSLGTGNTGVDPSVAQQISPYYTLLTGNTKDKKTLAPAGA